ncbi:condensin subunit ScpA [Alteribacillus persepolensis]|uniref:Segregation and condensation protein A n=1 Tax=Alteribacillus persepolensis TaxID=568899 RepID=A0A1G7ZMC3_9BACI|nr:segregation/condensation protein A [Alteribacillus persepolensis]SDH09911.1 condensin subunit ScpA [Alteribacillus persepolensis]
MKRYNVKIDSFEGPLDLLLHLIQQAEVDIYHIPLAAITDQYFQYVHAMQELELDIASEYLVMAATLLEIKSQMLLPNHTEEVLERTDEWEEEDPREELLDRLVEYKKYKEAASHLKEKEQSAGMHYAKSPTAVDEQENDDVNDVSEEVTLYHMLEAYQQLKKRVHAPSAETTVKAQEISMEERMNDIVSTLKKRAEPARFGDLFPIQEKPYIVTTFLAVLELVKHNEIRCKQKENFDEIMVEYKGDTAS